MRISYLANSIIPSQTANSINVMKMCAAFASLGHDVTLVVPDREPKLDVPDTYDFYGVADTFAMRVLRWLPIKGRSFIYALQAAREARRQSADVVYTRSTSCALAAILFRLDVILELHVAPAGRPRAELRLFSRSRKLRRVVCICQALADHVAAEYPALRGKTVVAHDGADSPGDVRPVPHDTDFAGLRAGYVGHLYPGKGMELIAELALRCPSIRFEIVGGMPEDIAHWKSELSDVDNVHLHGFVPHREVDGYLQSFDVLLAPYGKVVNPYGGGTNIVEWMSPLKLFEYMAAGKAIVCSDLPTLREVITDGEHGLLPAAGDVDGWADALHRLESEPELRDRLGAAARALFERHYTWRARAASIIEAGGFDS